MRRYLKRRRDESPALWVTHPRFGSERLTYDGLRSVLKRRADFAKVDAPTPHDFRRAFALSMLRQGVDIFTLAKLMGHADITVLRRYLRQTKEDTEAAHRQHGPVDNAGL
jgi:integrase/recombinase XerD